MSTTNKIFFDDKVTSEPHQSLVYISSEEAIKKAQKSVVFRLFVCLIFVFFPEKVWSHRSAALGALPSKLCGSDAFST